MLQNAFANASFSLLVGKTQGNIVDYLMPPLSTGELIAGLIGAAVTNFVVTPLSLLSGTFYSIHQLSPPFQAVSHLNPFFYVISGFRAGFLGVSDSPLWVGGLGLLALNVILWAACYRLLKSGWKIKS